MKHYRMKISDNHVIYNAVMLVLAIYLFKMKKSVGFFCFAVVEQLRGELISK